MYNILESIKIVASQSINVQINKEGISDFVKDFEHKDITHWLSEAPFDFETLNDRERLEFLLVFNSISFRYWGNPKWTVEYKDEEYDGSWAMIICIKRAIEEGKPILDSQYRSSLSKDDFQDILRGNIEIPLLEERLGITREVAGILNDKFDGDFENLINKSNGDALELLELIISNFHSFNDASVYVGTEVSFHKRAQLLVADIFNIFRGKNYGNLKNIDKLTACADYKLPQILRESNILKYSDKLAEQIDRQETLLKNSEEEIEIRANTILAVELIKEELKKLGKDFKSTEINDHIWLLSQNKDHSSKPYHLTDTTAY
jgi:hypothetical protein